MPPRVCFCAVGGVYLLLQQPTRVCILCIKISRSFTVSVFTDINVSRSFKEQKKKKKKGSKMQRDKASCQDSLHVEEKKQKYSEFYLHTAPCTLHYITVTSLLHSINVNKVFSFPSSDPLSSRFLITYWEDETLTIKYLSPFFLNNLAVSGIC